MRLDRGSHVVVVADVDGARAAYDQMVTQPDGGYILNTASLAGLMPAPWMTPYTTSKWAIVGFSRALRAEAAGRKITVTALCPGYVDTKLLDEVVDPSASVRQGISARRRRGSRVGVRVEAAKQRRAARKRRD